jgi:hypothetical protein
MLQVSFCLLPLVHEKVSASLTLEERPTRRGASEIVFLTDPQAENVPK